VDVEVGTSLPPWTVESVDAEKMKTMAVLLRDPNPIHWDVQAVRELGMGDRVINQGPNNMAYVVNMLIAWVADPARVRRVRVRFMGNVFAGDRLEASGEVTSIEDTTDGRVATCDVRLQRGEDTVLAGTAEVLLPP
jgi:acyl dehydratase